MPHERRSLYSIWNRRRSRSHLDTMVAFDSARDQSAHSSWHPLITAKYTLLSGRAEHGKPIMGPYQQQKMCHISRLIPSHNEILECTWRRIECICSNALYGLVVDVSHCNAGENNRTRSVHSRKAAEDRARYERKRTEYASPMLFFGGLP